MDVGRYYRDNSGKEFRYIGNIDETNSVGLFSTGESTIRKPLSDFEDMSKERKLFKFFGKGGITANDLLEARSFFGEAEWKKLKRQDRINSARYLKRTGKIGYKKGGKLPEPEESYYASMQYAKGGEISWDEYIKPMIENLNKLLNSGKIKIEDYTRAIFNLKNPKYANGGEIASIKKGIRLYKREAKKGDKNAKRNLEVLEEMLEKKQNPIVRTQFEEEEFEYKDGGKVMIGRYMVNVYYGGEMEDEEIYTDSLDEAKKISQQGEHSEIYDNVKKVFIEEYADGGELDEDSLDYNSISDLQSERNRLVRWKYQYNSKGADYKIKQLEERIEYLKSKDSKMADGGTLDYSKISNIEVEGIDKNDYPDFSDAYIYYAEYDGEPMTDKQIEELNENGEFVYEQIHRRLYARGGMLKDNLEKELNRLLRQINSPRLSVYTKGDTSEEEMSRRRERASKIARKDEILRVLNEIDSKMAMGGRTKFQDKADAIADSLEGKKVAPKYRKQYGAKYDRSEAEMAGKRIAGAMRKKYGI
jgi:hypothetical protein